jgi:hypothetical protein
MKVYYHISTLRHIRIKIRDNQKPQIEEGQKTQCPIEKEQPMIHRTACRKLAIEQYGPHK